MAATLFDYEKDLASGIRRSIAPEMAKLTDGNGINALVDRVATRIEAMIERNWPRPPAAKLLACRAGCAFCCNQFEVQVSALEALRVSDHVRTTFTPERRQALDRRIDEVEAKRAAVPLNDRLFHTLPCPLLEDGHCSIYAVRPFICRSVTSFDVEVCKAHAEMTPAQVAERLAGKSRAPANIPEHGMIRAIARAAKKAFGRAAEAAPGKGGMLDLARAVQAALAVPDAAKHWIAGAPLFDKALSRVGPQAVNKPNDTTF